jgi:hypothetical protein
MEQRPNIDWSVFDQYSESWCHCRCGTEFMSHTKMVRVGTELVCISRKKCPDCGRDDNIRRVSSDEWEKYTITNGDK